MAQHVILRFEKHKGNPARPLEANHERQKDQYASNPDIDTSRANLTKWQDDFYAYMVEKYPDLERGESASKTERKHISTRLFKQAVNLSKQARAIEATLDSISLLNVGKKKEEVLSMLKK